MSFPAALKIPEPVMEIARTLEDAGFEAWCVGGNLRDQLLGLPTAGHRDALGPPHSDYDIATSAKPEQVQQLFPHTVAVGIKYGTVGVLDRKRELHEVTTFRRDVTTDGRHAVVAYGVALEEDLARRDFTINAIAYHPIRREWRDPFGGAADLDRRLVRAVGDPAQRFREDYLRILRAVRFAARFGFTIDPATWEAARALSPGLTQLSAERVREEWFKGLRTALSVMQLASLWRSVGAAQLWIPELESEADGLAIPEPAPDHRDPVLLTALLSRNPVAILRRLKASNTEIERAAAIERGPDGPGGNDLRLVRHWLAGVGAAADDLSSLWMLRRGKKPPWAAAVQGIRAKRDPLTRSDLAITGADLQALGFSGPRIGQILATLLELVLDEPGLNTRDVLLAHARKLA